MLSSVTTGLYISNCMGAKLVYSLRCNDDQLERVWAFAQYKSLDMYKTRITQSWVGWVIEVPEGPMNTRFLLEFSQLSELLTGSLYY